MADIYLRCNTFVLLLLRSSNADMSGITGWGQKGKGVTKPKMLLSLLRMINPNHSANEKTLSQYFSQFLDGSRPTSKHHPLQDESFINQFEIRMKTEYHDVLHQMDEFCHTYLDFDNPLSMQQLVAGITVAIFNDKTISLDTQFDTGCGIVTKADLKTHRHFVLQIFLLSVWYYLVTSKAPASDGATTYKIWTGTPDPNSPAPITTKIGYNYADEFSVTTALPNNPADSAVQEDNTTDSFAEEEPIQAEIVDAPQQKQSQQENKTFNQQATIFNNYGNGPQIGVVNGNITFKIN